MSEVQYITNEAGERIGVVLDWMTYSCLSNPADLDKECLFGLSNDELNALESCKVAVAEQTRLDSLIDKNTDAGLSSDKQTELDDLLAKADQLTILKTRAKYTLMHLEENVQTA